MPGSGAVLLPEPGTLRPGSPPFLRGPAGPFPITMTFLAAAGVLIVNGTILFGWNSLRVLALCAGTAAIVERLTRSTMGRAHAGAGANSILIGALLACTLPAGVYWPVPVTAAVVAVLVGQVLSGGPGNYVWHPVALGRIAVELLFPSQMHPERWPVLGPGHLAFGSLSAARPLPGLWSWDYPLPMGAEAWDVIRPADLLRQPVPAREDALLAPHEAVSSLVRDHLPSWWEVLTGTAGGPIGEAGLLAVIVAGLWLMWRGWLRWPLPTLAVVSAAAAAAILPLNLQPAGAAPFAHWLPIMDFDDGIPVGLVYVIHQASAGELPFVLTLLACDPTSSPLTTRGHALFGVIIGILAIALRVQLGIPAAGYWALLIANALVPLINRATRRRVFGM